MNEPGAIRLQKILADAGVASRRAAEALIAAGRVSVNGCIVATLGTKANPERDDIRVDGRPLARAAPPVYLALNKPAGYVSTASDERGRPTVLDLVRDVPARLYPVGRLDRDSEGLLLLTNDGDLALRLTHPRYGVEKEYAVLLDREPRPEALGLLATGIDLDGRRTAPARVRRLERAPAGVWIAIALHEGRKRQIRRMCAALGLHVLRLIRVRIGPVRLGTLPPGAYRPLTSKEVEALYRAAGATAPQKHEHSNDQTIHRDSDRQASDSYR